MNCFRSASVRSTASVKPVDPKVVAKKEVLNNQRLQILFKDVENLIELSKHSFSRGGRILQRIDQCMDKMDEVGKEIVMDPAQMKRFLEYRKALERLALEVSSNELVYRW